MAGSNKNPVVVAAVAVKLAPRDIGRRTKKVIGIVALETRGAKKGAQVLFSGISLARLLQMADFRRGVVHVQVRMVRNRDRNDSSLWYAKTVFARIDPLHTDSAITHPAMTIIDRLLSELVLITDKDKAEMQERVRRLAFIDPKEEPDEGEVAKLLDELLQKRQDVIGTATAEIMLQPEFLCNLLTKLGESPEYAGCVLPSPRSLRNKLP